MEIRPQIDPKMGPEIDPIIDPKMDQAPHDPVWAEQQIVWNVIDTCMLNQRNGH